MRVPVPAVVVLIAATFLPIAPALAAPADAPAATGSTSREPAGRITEWSVPTNAAVRDPAIDPKGQVYFAVSQGNRIARFEPRAQKFTEWSLPPGTQPHGVVATTDGKVYFGGRGTGTIGELDATTGNIRLVPTPAVAEDIYSVTRDAKDDIWFTLRKSGLVGRLERATGRVTTFPMDGEPYGLVADARGRIWVTRIAAGSVGVLDPRTGEQRQVATGTGSRPRRLSIAPDGGVWVSLYGAGRIVRVNPVTLAIDRQLDLPGGAGSGPYSVAADSSGNVWVSLFQTDSVAVLNPASERFRTFSLPQKQSGIRNVALDAQGRFWYLATTTGKLGVIE